MSARFDPAVIPAGELREHAKNAAKAAAYQVEQCLVRSFRISISEDGAISGLDGRSENEVHASHMRELADKILDWTYEEYDPGVEITWADAHLISKVLNGLAKRIATEADNLELQEN